MITTTPPTSPSIPSMKFTALVQPRIQNSVSARPSAPSSTGPIQGSESRASVSPVPIATTAASACAPSFTVKRKSRTSSASATAAMTNAARITASSRPPLAAPSPHRAPMPSTKASTGPTPPPLGVGRVCALRASGWSRMGRAIIARTASAETRASTGASSSVGRSVSACMGRRALCPLRARGATLRCRTKRP